VNSLLTPVNSRITRISGRTHIPSLDGIRAVSFLVVFAGHAGLGRFVTPDIGVTIFFFLSGFLITTLMRSEFDNNRGVNIGHFWLRRALRILPPLYLVLLAATLMALVLYPPGTVHGSDLLAQLLFYSNYWGVGGDSHEAPGTGVVWSLAVEEHFYLLFPLLFVAMQKWRMLWRTQAWLLWGMCVLVLIWRCVLVLDLHSNSARIYCGTDTRIDSILFGCALALWNNPVLDQAIGSARLWKYLLLPSALVTLLLCLIWQGGVFRETWYFSIQGVALTFVFITAVRFPTWPPFRFLNCKPVAFVGVLSYSLYLVHQVFLKAVVRLWPHTGASAVVALIFSILAAWTIYVLIERPCGRLRRRLTNQ
jgi:peptidoglycan/LPS O-acetylase OafA/YrhL